MTFDSMTTASIDIIYKWVWGLPLLVLLLGLGIYLTVALRGLQIRYLPYALKVVFSKKYRDKGDGDISHFESLMTALAATVGIGNIAGVATAITIGGMGAIFWMWVTALIGMAIKYAEAILAVKYRTLDDKGEMCGGPMYFIEYGLGWKWLSLIFAFFGAVGAFGGGNILQANSVADVAQAVFAIDPFWSGVIMAAICGITLLGGIKSIGRMASVLVPFMALLYVGGAMMILIYHYAAIPSAFATIVTSAFTGQAAFGGFAGSTLILALQVGMSRGVMTSEAGLGTASIAAAAAKTDLPGRQALVSMSGGFLATIVMCSVTALVLSVTNVFGMTTVDGKLMTGASLTAAAFQSVFSYGHIIVAIGLILFAFTTIIGWAYYGEKCVEYIAGVRFVPLYRILFTLVVIPGATIELDIVWKISDICNGLMAIPNLVGITALSGVVIRESASFVKTLKAEAERGL